MAFADGKMVRLGDGVPNPDNTVSGRWQYRSNEALSAIDDANFFAPAYARGMRKGDTIEVIYDIDGTIGLANFVVATATSITAATVTLATATAAA